MSWYQTISVLLCVYCIWGLGPAVYNFVHAQRFTISLAERVFYTALFVNLILAFAGTPW